MLWFAARFLHRRKYLRHVLAAIWPDQWTKADVDRWLESQGIQRSASRRGAGRRGIRGARPCPCANASVSFREASRVRGGIVRRRDAEQLSWHELR